MGVVFEAQHMDLERRVALKILRAECCRRPELLELFRHEARTVSKIGSDYIVQVFDFAELPDGRLMFTMDLLDGPTLREVLDEQGPMDPARAIAILRQTCKGLAAAHESGVIHRDIKPENIVLVERNGRPDAVKLLDFGISAMLEDARSAAASRAGTPYYIAPEALSGMPHDARADLYSVGCLAYELLTGAPPFEGTETEVLQSQLDTDPTPPSQLPNGPSIPPALEAVVMRCLRKEPETRYDNADELEAALCEAQVEAGLQTGWDDLPLPQRIDPVRREKLLRAMPDPAALALPRSRGLKAAIAGLAIALGLVLTWALLRTPEPTPAEVDEIEQLASKAREAASRAFFVYPPPDNPNHDTAYRVILELEGLEGSAREAGEERAGELRQEFSSTLTRLGDEYWDADGGKPFAIDYYAAALVLDPDNEHAKSRAFMTHGELADLRQKATEQSFSRAELEAYEPLVVLAATDPNQQEKRLSKMQRRENPSRAASTDARLERLVDQRIAQKGLEPEADATDEDAPQDAVVADAEPLEDDEIVDVVEVEEAEPESDDEPKADPATSKDASKDSSEDAPSLPRRRRNPEAAAELVAKGEAAFKAGRHGEARDFFEQALAQDRRASAAVIGLSRIHFDHGRYTNAATLAERAVRLAPRNSEYRIRLGDAYYKTFRYADAAEQYRRASALGDSQAAGRLAKVADKLN